MSSKALTTPPQRRPDRIPDSKSSDTLPSPSLLLPTKDDPRRDPGSRAAVLPDTAAAGFQSASVLLKYNLLSLQRTTDAQTAKPKQRTGKRAVKAKDDIRPNDVIKEKPHAEKQRRTKTSTNESSQEKKAVKVTLGEESQRLKKRKSTEVTDANPPKHFAYKADDDAKRSATETSSYDLVTKQYDPLAEAKSRKRQKTTQTPGDGNAVGTNTKKTSTKRKTSKSSTHFSAATLVPARTAPPLVADEQHGALLAMKRQTDWTPPKPASPNHETAEAVQIDRGHSSSPAAFQTQPSPSSLNLAQLRKNYSYDKAQPMTQSMTVSPTHQDRHPASKLPPNKLNLVADPQPKKRKGNHTAAASHVAGTSTQNTRKTQPVLPEPVPRASRKASPKKGPGGITGRSIARYAPIKVIAEPIDKETPPHLAPSFEPPVNQKLNDHIDTTKDAKKTKKTRGPRTNKAGAEKEPRKRSAAKVKIVPAPAPKLVSPRQHDAKLKRQDLLFGTSSQLYEGLSPELIRTMQVSLHETAIEEVEEQDSASLPIAMHHAHAVRRTQRKLWAESAQEDSGSAWHCLSDFEISAELGPNKDNGVVASTRDNTFTPIDAFAPIEDREIAGPAEAAFSVPIASNGFWLQEKPPDTPFSRPATALATTTITISSSPRPSVSPTRVALRPLSTNTKSPTKSQVPDNPTNDKETTASNTNELLESAASQVARARGQKDVNSEQALSPTKPRGRPRKLSASSPGPQTPRRRGRPLKSRIAVHKETSSHALSQERLNTEFRHIDDIEDSEPDHTPSPRRKLGSPAGSQPLPLTTADDADGASKRLNTLIVNASHPRWPVVKGKLFAEITTAVKSAPSTRRTKHPSWYEKILLYDPIVLEDLTAWLNEQGLRVEGKDRAAVEISPWMTQSWCETNSICCLWKDGLRGGVRVRY